MRAIRIIGRLVLIGAVGLVSPGCIPALPLRHLSVAEPAHELRPRLEFAEAGSMPSEPTTLTKMIDIAVKHHPDVKAARARVEIARGNMIQAGLYPNPSIGPNFAQLGDSANRTGEAGARFSQTIVTANKLGIAKAAGERAVEAADWQALTKWHDVVTRVRLVYFEVLTARRERDTAGLIVGYTEKAYKIAEKLDKAGVGSRPEMLRAKVELEQNKLKMEVADRHVEAAEQNLLTALGRPALALDRLELNPKELERRPPEYDWKSMLICLRDSSSELQESRALIAQQERLLAKAQADRVPNLSLTAIPFYESFAREMRFEVYLTAPVPIFDRNQGNIHAAKHALNQSLSFERQVELRLTERLTGAYQRYRTALKQCDAYRALIVPGAEESLKLVEAGYSGGDTKYDYKALLQAQQVLSQAKLAHTQAMGELWRSVVEIAGILQQESLHSGCAVVQRRL